MTRVRRARLADALDLARVEVASWRAAYRMLLPGPYLAGITVERCRDRWVRRLAASDDADDHWVLLHEDALVGFCTAGPSRAAPDFAAEVFMLYLHPDRWCRGLGAALLEKALARLAARSFGWVYVWVLADNARARRFYGRFGLATDGERRLDRTGGRRVSVVRYAGVLNPVFPWPAEHLHNSDTDSP
jgi:ribosomal protein S18 acetylase RimI-like enzyme